MKASTKLGLDQYVKYRIPTGGFLHTVLSNDLMGAIEKADKENRDDIFEICQYIHNNLPVICYGSAKAVSEWLQERYKV